MIYKIILSGLFFCFINPAIANVKRHSNQLESVTVQLRYIHQFQFAGFYAAINQGYYKEVGLKVSLIEARLGEKTVDEVLSGKSQYGQTQTDLLYYRLQGKPLVALAPIFQHSPAALMVKNDSNILSPHDLIGKRLMLEMGDNAISTLAMLEHEGVKLSDIKVVSQSYGIDELIAGTVDAVGVYLTNRPFLVQQAGIKYRILNPINYGIDFYGDTLFTTEQEVKKHPERTANFLKATLKGWHYAMNNPTEIIDLLINQYGVKKSREHLLFEAQAIKKLMLPDLVEIGHMNPGRWQRMADIFVKQGKAPKNYSLDQFIYIPDKPWYKQYWIRYLIIAIGLLFVATFCFIYYWRLSKQLKRVIFERNVAEKNSLRLDHVLERSSNEIYIFDTETLRFKQVNEGARKNLGYSQDELKKMTPLDLKTDYTWHSFKQLISPVNENAKKQILFETSHTRKDGSHYPVEVRLQKYDETEPPVYYAIVNDITDRNRIYQELLEKNSELERFIYMISHDLKSPLVTVKTFLSYLEQDIQRPDTQRVYEDMRFMSTAASKMEMLLDDLLEFSRIGRKGRLPSTINFDRLIQNVLSICAGSIAEQHIKTKVTETDLTLLADQTEMIQIWQNLIENSIKYIGTQTNPVIEIGVQQSSEDPVFFVKDNGIGVDPQFHEKIFEIFEQLDAKIEGSGLGLALIKRIIEFYQGDIKIESKGLGQGACILFTLPDATQSHKQEK